MQWVKHGVRFLLVTVGIVVLTSLGIDASQYLSGSSSALGILADRATEGACPAGMSFVEAGADDFCIDTYEVAVSDACPVAMPLHDSQTAENVQAVGCVAVSESGEQPWVHVTYHQARELCGKAGKRLPSNKEWYQAALGTTESACNIDGSGVEEAGHEASCVSGMGAHDMVGNVWEWIDAVVEGGVYDGRSLPEAGFVHNADNNGVALVTNQNPQSIFHDDYFWSNPNGSFVMMRGGFYASGEDAGLYSVHADIAQNFSGAAIGFRCVRDV